MSIKEFKHSIVKKKILSLSLAVFISFFMFSGTFKKGEGDKTKTKPSFGVKTIVIDPGHGGKDPGCHGLTMKEKDVALAVSLKLGKYIEENLPDVKVVYTRKTDIFPSLQERADIANRVKADLFVSIHCNSACVRDKKKKRDICNEEANGAETYVMGIKNEKGKLDVAKRENSAILLEDDYVKKYQGFDPNSDESYIIMSMFTDAYLESSLTFAAKIQNNYKNRAQREDKGVKRASLWVLWRTSMPSVLTEIGFLTNPDEEKFLGSEDGQNKVAFSIYKAFKDYKAEMEGVKIKGDDKEEMKKVDTDVPAIKEEVKQIPKEEKKVEKKDSVEGQKEVVVAKKDTLKPVKDTIREVANKVEVVLPDTIKKSDDIAQKLKNAINKAKLDSIKKAEAEFKNKANQSTPEKVIHKVQIYSSEKKLPNNFEKFKGLEKVGSYELNGMYKYTEGEFDSQELAVKKQAELRSKGFSDCFVVTFYKGKRITAEEAKKIAK